MADAAKAARRALVESVGEVDDEMVRNRRSSFTAVFVSCISLQGDIFLSESDPTHPQLEAAIRRATIKTAFVPVLMGSA